MTSAIRRRASLRNAATGIPLLVLLWLAPLSALTGELSALSVDRLPEFTLADLSGEPRSLNDFAGKVVLVNFWASWCAPCIQEMPTLIRLQDAMRGYPFTVVGINVAEGERRVQTAVKRLGLNFPVLLDRESRVFKAWGGVVLPTAYILDRNGRGRYLTQGPLDWDRVDIQETLKDLLRQSADLPATQRERGDGGNKKQSLSHLFAIGNSIETRKP